MPPQLFRRIRAFSPNREDEGSFDEYKVIIEEVKREHPDLPPSVQQQMAVKRFSRTKEKRLSQNENNLMKAMSNFRFGRGNKATEDLSTKTYDTSEPEDRRRSLNPRTSVARIDTKSLTQSFLEIPSDDENSLEDSLLNIEASAAPRRQPSRRVRRESQKRASLTRSSTELLDVQEDKVLHASIPESLAHSKDRTQSSDQDLKKSTKNSPDPHRSISDDLPDEIKVALGLGEFDNDDGQRSVGSHDKSEGRRRSRVHESIRSSNSSSFLSIDSANFEGDFSAWGSRSSK